MLTEDVKKIGEGIVSLFYQIDDEFDFIQAISKEVPDQLMARFFWVALSNMLEAERQSSTIKTN